MQRVCLITNTFWPEIGAASGRLTRWADELHVRGCEVLVITALPAYPKPSLYKKTSLEPRPYRIYRFPQWLYLGKSFVFRILSMLSLALPALLALPAIVRFRPTVIIAQSPPPVLATLALLFSKLLRTKFILNVSDLWPQAIVQIFGEKSCVFSKFIAAWMKLLYRYSDALTVQSIEIQNFLSNSKFKVQLFRFGAAEDFFQVRPKVLTDNILKVYYTGTIGLAHGLFGLVSQYWPATKAMSLTIVGEGYERDMILKYLKNNNVSNVNLLSPVRSTREVAQLLEQADIVLVCQRTRLPGTVPAKLYEAMAAARPVWFHGAGEGAELVRQSGCGLVSTPDKAHTFEAVAEQWLETTLAIRQQMGENGRNFARQHFNGDKIASEFANFVIKIIEDAKNNHQQNS